MRKTILKRLNAAGIFLILISGPAYPQIPESVIPAELKSVFRADHPRIFFNADTFPALKRRALTEEAELLAAMQAR